MRTFTRKRPRCKAVGLAVSSYVQTDDTGARHQGQNGYCTYLGNEWFAWFASTESKSRVNFLELLQTERCYAVNAEALGLYGRARRGGRSPGTAGGVPGGAYRPRRRGPRTCGGTWSTVPGRSPW